ncbi:DUF3885 domain-containing protein [Shouchella miscanthi]|uniref:DUF3885 domain-containing protein n=1 Tax=Shouchella miscanthi TaxID=2598861 RepID=UPI0011A8CC86|nr:hypothetical protein [Shouchella miscanthi]
MNHLIYLRNEFKELDLINSTFHDLPLSLHIELQESLYQLDDSGNINFDYFDTIYSRATDIFKDLFINEDQLFFVTVARSEKAISKPIGLFNKFINRINQYKLHTFEENDEFGRLVQYSLQTQKKFLHYNKIIKAICNQDFKDLTPRFNDKLLSTYPEVFFINKDKGIIFHIYDDRGAFLLFNDEKLHKEFAMKYSNLIRREE